MKHSGTHERRIPGASGTRSGLRSGKLSRWICTGWMTDQGLTARTTLWTSNHPPSPAKSRLYVAPHRRYVPRNHYCCCTTTVALLRGAPLPLGRIPRCGPPLTAPRPPLPPPLLSRLAGGGMLVYDCGWKARLFSTTALSASALFSIV